MPTLSFRSIRLRFAVFISLTLLIVLIAPARIARADPGVIRVKVNGATSGTCGDQTDWSNACGLQYALTTVAVSGDEIWVASGMYTPTTTGDRAATFQLKSGVAVYGGFAGGETERSQRNWTTNVVVLSGDLNGDDVGFTNNGENSYRVVTGANGATLDGVTVSGGNANGSDPYDNGGGMYNLNGSPTLTNVTFSSNSAHEYGGGMFSGGNPTLSNVTFSGNSALTDGGGMFNDGGSPSLTNVTFSGNSAIFGGGMYNDSGSPTLTNVTFSSNSASFYGGGMYNNEGSPSLTNVTFSSNSATFGGGGINNNSSNPTLTDVTFSNNSAKVGGGMGNSGGSNPVLTNVTFNGNIANVKGGGVTNVSSSPTLTNVTFSGNSAGVWGGGVYNEASSPTLTNVTFSGNSAANIGGGMYNLGTSTVPTNLTIRNTILWGNTAPTGSQIYDDEYSTSSVSDSVVQGSYAGGTNIITTDPLLDALGNYGGSTQTTPLLPGSSAIDAGNDTFCPATDQRGIFRHGAHCDIGAFESQGFTLTKTGGDSQSAPINTAFANALTVSVSNAYGEPVDGGVVSFVAPSSGASTNPTSRAVTIASNVASANFSANGIVGAYAVNATTGNTTVSFGLANLKANTTTTITSSPNPSLLGNTVTFTVTVTSPSGGTPTGTVDFYETTSPSAPVRAPSSSQPLVGGIAIFTASSLSVGTHNLQAQYSGDANYNASNSALYPQQVQSNPALNLFLPWVSK